MKSYMIFHSTSIIGPAELIRTDQLGRGGPGIDGCMVYLGPDRTINVTMSPAEMREWAKAWIDLANECDAAIVDAIAEAVAESQEPGRCPMVVVGYRCTREAGHDGAHVIEGDS